MTIGFVSSLAKPTTLASPGGQEVWGATFILELIKRSYKVDLYSVKKSVFIDQHVNLIEVLDQSLEDLKQNNFFNDSILSKLSYITYTKIALMLKMCEQKYDLIIDSSANPTISMNTSLFSKPFLVIGHFPTTSLYIRLLQTTHIPNNVYFSFPSSYQFNHVPFIPMRQKFVIPHGIDIRKFIFSYQTTNSMLWMGRVDRDSPKGIQQAIEVSQKTRFHLNLFPYIQDEKYFQSEIKPRLYKNIVISAGIADRNRVFQNAKLFLFPVQWEEPFGLVMIESMACGTPVVAFARGSVPEVIKDGETGFIVNPSDDDIRGNWIIKKTGIEGLCEAVERIYGMSEDEYRAMRRACREHVEENFTVERMVDNYEKVYKKILSQK